MLYQVINLFLIHLPHRAAVVPLARDFLLIPRDSENFHSTCLKQESHISLVLCAFQVVLELALAIRQLYEKNSLKKLLSRSWCLVYNFLHKREQMSSTWFLKTIWSVRSTISTEMMIFGVLLIDECSHLILFSLLCHEDDVSKFEAAFDEFALFLSSLLTALEYAISSSLIDCIKIAFYSFISCSPNCH